MTTQSPRGKVPRRKVVTREQLISAAEECFLEFGYHGASANRLAAKAGYTYGAIYSSFGDKAGLFLAVLERRSDVQMVAWRDAASAPDPEYQLSRMLERAQEDDSFVRWSAAFFEFAAVAVRDPALRASLSEIFIHTRKNMTDVLAPLIRRSTIPAEDFVRLVQAVSNGLSLFAPFEEAPQRNLMAVVLPRLQDEIGETS